VLADGRIIEQGTPAQLLTTDSTFAALLAIEEAGWDWENESTDSGRTRPV